MDKEQARFVLCSFRPDGADAGDGEFADALRLSAEDRELGEWLADERAADSAFAKALGSVVVPERLRGAILAGRGADFGGLPQAETDADAAMIGAFASIQPSSSLRGELLTAMHRTALEKNSPPSRWGHAAWPMAAAAGIALAFFLTGRTDPARSTLATNPPNTVPVEVVQASFIRTFESPLFSMDENAGKPGRVMKILEEKNLPCPTCLPPGLVGVKSIGCRELLIDGKRGSLVCFDEAENGMVHLVIFKREDVCGDLPGRDRPAMSQNGPWAVARWVDEGHVFVLLGSRPMEKLAGLF